MRGNGLLLILMHRLNDAQLALTQARLTASQAVYNYLTAKANLENTLGADFTVE